MPSFNRRTLKDDYEKIPDSRWVHCRGVFFIVSRVRILCGHTKIHQAEGPALYSGVGAWTRIDEYAHAQGKTNYIDFADKQLAMLKDDLDIWKKGAPGSNITNLEKMQTDAYERTDRNIKSGLNPLAYLDQTNATPQPAGKQ